MENKNELIRRKIKTKCEEKQPKETDKRSQKDSKEPKYGPMIKFPNQRMWSRSIILVGLMVYVWYSSANAKNEISFAKQKDAIPIREMSKECDREYFDEIRKFPGCMPKFCGRFVTDNLVTTEEADILLNLAKKGLLLGGSSGGASIIDLHTGAISKGETFVNVYKLKESKKFMNPKDLTTYKIVRNKIQHAISEKFSVDINSIYLTYPTFFSRMDNSPPKTLHDEYWHAHVDQETYDSFHYTSLLYLNDYSLDFKGGRFVFIDKESGSSTKNVTVEPRKGRVLFFTSGAENPHFIEPVIEGTRFAITISFTCDKKHLIKDPEGGV